MNPTCSVAEQQRSQSQVNGEDAKRRQESVANVEKRKKLEAMQIDSSVNQRSDQGCHDCSRDVTACQSKWFRASVR
ncbi:hypothetical protein RISK_001248 [Rhodopirellula islandica]|uniref:Uncharacterized protein n=1 Tax=Rhodopirellula islandica TaxID=595434 RepID=A0A0J1EMC2_RHOIS|nr:hypothetical protein RISK_001248 [Rhodopirellula islandica]